MPRLTEESKRRRMEQIADAAMRCFAREGFRDTTMADIIAESGLSAGSIYSHFQSKGELLRMVASEVLETRVRGVIEAAAAASTTPLTPGTLFDEVVTSVFEPDRARVLVQVWGEAPTDPELGQIAHDKMHQVRRLVIDALGPWAAEHGGSNDERLSAVADVFLTGVQGYAVRRTLDPGMDAAALAAGLRAVLDRC